MGPQIGILPYIIIWQGVNLSRNPIKRNQQRKNVFSSPDHPPSFFNRRGQGEPPPIQTARSGRNNNNTEVTTPITMDRESLVYLAKLAEQVRCRAAFVVPEQCLGMREAKKEIGPAWKPLIDYCVHLDRQLPPC
jgi:hypothetical protein